MYKQKINKLLIGTNNKGKLREIKSLLPKNIKIYSTTKFNLKSPVENGKTFKENSLIKSKFFLIVSKPIVIKLQSMFFLLCINLATYESCVLSLIVSMILFS